MADARAAQILDWLDRQHEPMTALLASLVNTDSNSYDKAGVDHVVAMLRDHLETAGLACETIAHEHAGNCLMASVPGETPAAEGGHVLLLGHCDTVFPAGTATERPFRMDGDRAFGPGVADMKAGLVMNAFVLEAFARHGGAPRPLLGLFTSDEEIASPSSRPVIEGAARGARAVFNAEPGRPSGNLVTARKGAMFLTVEATGKAAHSGSAHQDGASAIEALCRKVQALHALTDYESGTTVNVGLMQGGVSINTTAPWAKARVDVRFWTIPALESAEAAIRAIVDEVEVAGTAARITERAVFLPLEQTEASRDLFERYVAAATELGVSVEGESTGGSADSGFTSAAGVPTLCGTGPVGAKAHSPDEVCHLDTMIPRAKAVALTILGLD